MHTEPIAYRTMDTEPDLNQAQSKFILYFQIHTIIDLDTATGLPLLQMGGCPSKPYLNKHSTTAYYIITWMKYI